MPANRSHGGACCGIFHIYNMSPYVYNPVTRESTALDTVETWRAELVRHLKQHLSPTNNNRVAEIVLRDIQCRDNPMLLTAMGQLGFKPVTRFRNSNSGNNVTIFHRIEKSLPLDNLPFVLGTPDVAVGYQRRYASGRLSAVYRTREQAEAYRGRAVVAAIVEAPIDSTAIF